MRDKYINPLTDFGFKKLFGTEPNKILLIDFLNQILPDKQIKDLTYASGEKQGNTIIDRKAVFDLYCVGENGEHFIVEMQKAKQNYFKDRSLYYASFPIQEQGQRNQWDFKLNPVYSVGILDFIFDDHKNEKELLHIVELKNQRCEVFYKKLKFVYIELPKFTKTEKELVTQFDKWLYVFTHLSQLQNRPKALQEKVFKKLFETAEIATFTPQEREAYEDSLKYYRDIKNVVDTSREEGLEQGREEGLERGREERNLEIARNMKLKGMSDEAISEFTGLSQDTIQKL